MSLWRCAPRLAFFIFELFVFRHLDALVCPFQDPLTATTQLSVNHNPHSLKPIFMFNTFAHIDSTCPDNIHSSVSISFSSYHSANTCSPPISMFSTSHCSARRRLKAFIASLDHMHIVSLFLANAGVDYKDMDAQRAHQRSLQPVQR